MCSRPMSPSAMSDGGAARPWWKPRLLPQSLLGRLSAVMVVGVLLTQLVGNVIWAAQRRAESEVEVGTASLHLAHSAASARSEEHTSELQSLRHLVCRLLLEK